MLKNAKKVKKILKERTRNAGTMTESMFWSMIRSALRKISYTKWLPIVEFKKSKRLPASQYSTNKRLKWVWKCEQCGAINDAKHSHVDHNLEAGSLRNSDDLKGFVERLFVESGFTILCDKCNYAKRDVKP